MKNITKTTFEFNRMTSESVPEHEFLHEKFFSLTCKESGHFYYDTFYGETFNYSFIYNKKFLLKVFWDKIEIFQKDYNCVKSLSKEMDRNFRLNILTDGYNLFNVSITKIYYKHKIFNRNKKYKLNSISATEIALLLDKYRDNSIIFLIENENIIVANNITKGMFFIMRIEKIPSFGDCLKSLYATFMKLNIS